MCTTRRCPSPPTHDDLSEANAGNTKGVDIDKWMRGTLRHFAGRTKRIRYGSVRGKLVRTIISIARLETTDAMGKRATSHRPLSHEHIKLVRIRARQRGEYAQPELLNRPQLLHRPMGVVHRVHGLVRDFALQADRAACSDGAAQRREDEDRTDVDAATWSIQDRPWDFKFCKDFAVGVCLAIVPSNSSDTTRVVTRPSSVVTRKLSLTAPSKKGNVTGRVLSESSNNAPNTRKQRLPSHPWVLRRSSRRVLRGTDGIFVRLLDGLCVGAPHSNKLVCLGPRGPKLGWRMYRAEGHRKPN
ncbi:hypothetical protein GGX14DRAFT_474420 [Mycena pura]|uniref:Uncharacterized protein n=1 Tax=Mycena pura TaxID=153505 RepID=A0AAD6Y492_9AGAR|nr:hypothetical protein GGX14DRAFT_474420 [Mycena pura]